MTVHPSATPARARSLSRGPGLLRLALRVNALVTGANGLAYLAVAGPLGDLLGVPSGVLRATGLFLLAFAAVVWLAGSAAVPRAGAVWVIVAVNALWVVDSLALVAFDWWSPSTAGTVWVVMQAATVAAFALLQIVGLQRLAAR